MSAFRLPAIRAATARDSARAARTLPTRLRPSNRVTFALMLGSAELLWTSSGIGRPKSSAPDTNRDFETPVLRFADTFGRNCDHAARSPTAVTSSSFNTRRWAGLRCSAMRIASSSVNFRGTSCAATGAAAPASRRARTIGVLIGDLPPFVVAVAWGAGDSSAPCPARGLLRPAAGFLNVLHETHGRVVDQRVVPAGQHDLARRHRLLLAAHLRRQDLDEHVVPEPWTDVPPLGRPTPPIALQDEEHRAAVPLQNRRPRDQQPVREALRLQRDPREHPRQDPAVRVRDRDGHL